MHRMIRTIPALVPLLALLGGCAGEPGGNWIGANTPSDIGELPGDYRRQAEAAVKSRLKDPYSAVIEVGAASRAQCAIGVYGTFHGWRVPVCYNAKNSYGAYVGQQCGFVWIANGSAKRVSDYPGLCP